MLTKEKPEEHNPNWQQIPDHPNTILIAGGSESGKVNLLFNLIIHQPDNNQIQYNNYMLKVHVKQNINS